MRGTLNTARHIHWLVATLLSALFLLAGYTHLSAEDEWGPEGIRQGFTVVSIPPGMDQAAYLRQVEESARRSHVNIYKSALRSQASETFTDYYVFIGEPSRVFGNVATQWFPAFGSRYSADLKPAESMSAANIAGTYLTQGTSDQIEALEHDLHGRHIQIEPFTGSPASLRWIGFFVRTPLGPAALMLWLAATATAANFRSARLAVSSLRRSAGDHPITNFGMEAIALSSPLLIAAVGPPFLLAAYAYIFRNGYRSTQALALSVPLFAVDIGICVFILISIEAFQRRVGLSSLLKGARPHALISVCSVTAIVAASALAVHTGAAVLHAAHDEHDARVADAFRARHRDLFTPALGYAILSPDADRIRQGLADAAETLEAEGGVWMCDAQSLADGVDGSHSELSIVVVNSTYFRSVPGVDARLAATVKKATDEPGGAALVTPTASSPDMGRRAETTSRGWLEFQVSLRPEGDRAQPHLESFPGHDLGIVPLLDQFRLEEQTYRRNPTVLVVNASSKLLSARSIAVSSSYTDPDGFRALVDAHSVGYAIVSMDSVARLSELDALDRAETMRSLLLGTAAMAVSLALAAGILAATSFARRTPQIFLQSSTGMSFQSIHRRFLVSTALLTCGPAIGVALVSHLTFLEVAALMGTIVVITLGCATSVLAVQQGTVHRTGLEQT